MQYVCENENEDVLRLLASNSTVKDLILEIGASTSSLAKLKESRFRYERDTGINRNSCNKYRK